MSPPLPSLIKLDALCVTLQIASMETDPYNILGNVRARTANELLHAFGHIARHEAELELPIYAHHGTKDRLANLGVSVPSGYYQQPVTGWRPIEVLGSYGCACSCRLSSACSARLPAEM